MEISDTTDPAALVGQTLSTDHFGPFTVLSADHAPDVGAGAIAYSSRDVEHGYLSLGFMPYGSQAYGEEGT